MLPGATGNVAPAAHYITGLDEPYSVALDAAGNLYVTNAHDNQVRVFAPGASGAATPLSTITTGVSNPQGITVDPAGSVYVANSGSGTVTVYPAGATSPSLTISGLSNPQQPCRRPPSGDIYVPLAGANQVLAVYSPSTGSFMAVDHLGGTVDPRRGGLRLFGRRAGGQLLWRRPDRVHRRRAPRLAAISGSATTFNHPAWYRQPPTFDTGTTVSVVPPPTPDVFIADTDNNRVLKVPAGGGPQTTVGSGLSGPFGVAVDAAGDVFVASTPSTARC